MMSAPASAKSRWGVFRVWAFSTRRCEDHNGVCDENLTLCSSSRVVPSPPSSNKTGFSSRDLLILSNFYGTRVIHRCVLWVEKPKIPARRLTNQKPQSAETQL